MRLIFIIFSQFLSGTIWFAANVAYEGQGFLLSAVQIGFILGTLSFAFLNLSDRYSPVLVFLVCAVFGSIFNVFGVYLKQYYYLLLFSRLCCGVCLAGIYPVGMKIAASWYPETISNALGWLVGALVLASGFPYCIKLFSLNTNPSIILYTTSVLCFTGGLIQYFAVKDGPFLPRGSKFDMSIIPKIFQHPGFRASSFGYFGHMWELYAVFAYVPIFIQTIIQSNTQLYSFAFFVFGFLGCALGGIIAQKVGSRRVALVSLFISGSICLLSPLIISLPAAAALSLIFVWGITVVSDSPQFSALNARFAPKEYVGSALTIVNCIGFSITIITIELLDLWIDRFGIRTAFMPLIIGPFTGWLFLKKYPDKKSRRASFE